MIQELFIVMNIVYFAIQFERKHHISTLYITFVFNTNIKNTNLKQGSYKK